MVESEVELTNLFVFWNISCMAATSLSKTFCFIFRNEKTTRKGVKKSTRTEYFMKRKKNSVKILRDPDEAEERTLFMKI